MMRKAIVDAVLKKISEKDFNIYRKYYDSFSFEEIKYINNEINKLYPAAKQADFNFDMFVDIFASAVNYYSRPIRIIELGPHQGYLAKQTLELYDNYIEFWNGYELSKYPITTSVVTSTKYSIIELNDYFYNTQIPDFDLFCSTHTFEHLNKQEVELCVEHIRNCGFIAIEVPRVDMMEVSWDGYSGTHILVIPQKEFIDIFERNGFKLIYNEYYFRNWWVSGWTRWM